MDQNTKSQMPQKFSFPLIKAISSLSPLTLSCLFHSSHLYLYLALSKQGRPMTKKKNKKNTARKQSQRWKSNNKISLPTN